MPDRPPIPAELKRRLLVEAGHRCAIPTCRHPTTEIAHIEPFANNPVHEYANLIALCPNCHTRFDRGEIDRKAMRIYKRRLLFLGDRYSKYELNVLDFLRTQPRVVVNGPLTVKGLLDDELLEMEAEFQNMQFSDGYKAIISMSVRLTEKGRVFLAEWADPTGEQLTYDGT